MGDLHNFLCRCPFSQEKTQLTCTTCVQAGPGESPAHTSCRFQRHITCTTVVQVNARKLEENAHRALTCTTVCAGVPGRPIESPCADNPATSPAQLLCRHTPENSRKHAPRTLTCTTFRAGVPGRPSSPHVPTTQPHHLHNLCAGKRSGTRGKCTAHHHLHNLLCRCAGPPLESPCADDPATSPAQLLRK